MSVSELHDLSRLRKWRPFPIHGSAFQVARDLFGGTMRQVGPVSFRLRRIHEGTVIFFTVAMDCTPAFTWNVSNLLGIYPKSFQDARKWVRAYAAGYGQSIVETRPDREKQPTGADGKLLKSGGCKESWLDSEIPKLFAEAATRCQHGAGFCLQDGYCHYGECNMEMDVPLLCETAASGAGVRGVGR